MNVEPPVSWLQHRWYALNRTLGRILDRPLRSRRQVAALFGLQIAVNGGVSPRRLAAVGVEFCRGRDIEEPPRHWVKVSAPEELLRIDLAAGGRPGTKVTIERSPGDLAISGCDEDIYA